MARLRPNLRKKPLGAICSGVWSCAIIALSPVAQAQDDASTGRRSLLEEVTVTARRTEETLQSVPVAVTAFSATELRESTISTPEDIQVATPGVHLSGSGGGKSNAVYQIRGQSKALSGTSSPAVVTYFAEVPEPNYGSFLPQYDMGSIQVLKGPQGTLFGRNTTGGAILFSPVTPSYEFDGYIAGEVGNYGLGRMQGAVTIPIIDQRLSVRLAGDWQVRDGYSEDLRDGDELDEIDSEAFRISVLFEPTDAISNVTIYDHYKSDTSGTASVPTAVRTGSNLLGQLGIQSSALDVLAAQNARGPYEVDTSREQFERLDRTSITNRTEIEIGDMTLINIFGYRDVELAYLTNVDGFGPLITDGTGAYPAGVPLELVKGSLFQELEQFSNELQLRGNAFDDRLDWLVGAFWLKNEPSGPQSNWVSFAHIVGTPDAPTTFNFVTEESQALFAHFTYGLDPLLAGLELEVGVRYTEDEVESCTGIGTSSFPLGTDIDDCEAGDTSRILNSNVVSAESNETTWSVGLNWQIDPSHFAYVVSRHGYRAGGVNAPTFSGRMTAYQAFAPETVTDFEAGLRSDWVVGGMDVRTNLTAFVGYYDDVQSVMTGVQTAATLCTPGINNPPGVSPDGDCDINNDPAGGTFLANLGEAKVSGGELEIIVAPTDRLTLNVGGSYVSPKTEKFQTPTSLEPYLAGSEEIPFNYTADKSFVAGVRYEHPVNSPALREVVFNADYYWTDDIPYVDTFLDSYSLTNIRIGFNGIGMENLDLALFVRNAFDEEYQTTGNIAGAFLGFDVGLFGPPRMYGAELRYSFD